MNIFRHGDISLHPHKKVVGKEIKHKGSFVLAEGEVTGHNHTIITKEGTLDIFKDSFGGITLIIDGKAILTHPEHKTIEIPTGTYKMKNEREYDHFAHTVRKVLD